MKQKKEDSLVYAAQTRFGFMAGLSSVSRPPRSSQAVWGEGVGVLHHGQAVPPAIHAGRMLLSSLPLMMKLWSLRTSSCFPSRRNGEMGAIESCMAAIEVEIVCLKLETDLFLESRG